MKKQLLKLKYIKNYFDLDTSWGHSVDPTSGKKFMEIDIKKLTRSFFVEFLPKNFETLEEKETYYINLWKDLHLCLFVFLKNKSIRINRFDLEKNIQETYILSFTHLVIYAFVESEDMFCILLDDLLKKISLEKSPEELFENMSSYKALRRPTESMEHFVKNAINPRLQLYFKVQISQ